MKAWPALLFVASLACAQESADALRAFEEDELGSGVERMTLFPRLGEPADDVALPAGPGLVLMGGGPDVDAAFRWARATIGGGRAGRLGDVVVLRASGADGYDAYLHAVTEFASVQTILLPERATAAELDAAASIVRRSEVVFFAGGAQSRYVAWKGTSLADAVTSVYARGGVVGGTSAGCAILGASVYDGRTAGASNLSSRAALADPFSARISFTQGMFAFPSLRNAITDTHFAERDRLGRLLSFMARQITDGVVAGSASSSSRVLGIGVGEGSAILVDRDGHGLFVRQRPQARAFVVRGGTPALAVAGKPLGYDSLRVFRLDADGARFDFGTWCGRVPSYELAVNGGAFTPAAPYEAPAIEADCL